MIIKHINQEYFMFCFDKSYKDKDVRTIVKNLLNEQTELFYIIEEPGIYTNNDVIARVIDARTFMWLKLMCNF